jgi:hypothetical protein
MKPDPSKLLKEALKLSLEARAALATSLLESLDEAVRVRARAGGGIGERQPASDAYAQPTSSGRDHQGSLP